LGKENIEIQKKLETERKSNQELNLSPLGKWVRQGKELHKDETICQFCGNTLPEDLLTRLEKHFSKDFEKLQNDIDNLMKEIEKHKKNSIEAFKNQVPDENSLYEEFKTDFENKKKVFDRLLSAYLDTFKPLDEVLNDKKKNPFTEPTPEKDDVDVKTIIEVWHKLVYIFSKHNGKTKNFEAEKGRNKKALEKHFVAEFIKDEKYIENNAKVTSLGIEVETIEYNIIKSEKKIREFKSKISDVAKGAEKLNETLSLFFSDDALQIEPTKEGKFRLLRHNEVAKNLSEGEKTIISFSYFIAHLEDKDTSLCDSIVFIDDPVCSLDLSHLYSIYALIENKFQNDGFSQFFVTTHNMEFLNLMKDFIKDRCNLKDNKDETLKKAPFYFIKMTHNKNAKDSKIEGMPCQLKKFRSEYVYLFSILDQFCNDPKDNFEMLYLLPNIARRFLETYLGFKYPDGKSIHNKNKISRLISDSNSVRVLKFVNQYSHSTTSERIIKFPDLSECQEVVNLVLDAVKNHDKDHFDTLCEQCKS